MMDNKGSLLPQLNQVIWHIKVKDVPSMYKYRGYVNGVWFKDFIEPQVSNGLVEMLFNEISAYIYENLLKQC